MAQIVCFGDSITLGLVDPEGGWTQRLRRRLDAEETFTVGDVSFSSHVVLNLGISGDTAEDVLDRLERELLPRMIGERTVVVIAVGINETAEDLPSGKPRFSLDDFAANLAGAVETARGHADHVLLVELLPCDETRVRPAPWDPAESYSNDRIRAFNEALRRVARDHDVPVAGLFDDFLAAGHEALLHDGVHPNADGHQRIADVIGERVRAWL